MAFPAEVPDGTERFSGSEPAGCSFWRLAAAGRTFATVAVGSLQLPDRIVYPQYFRCPKKRAKELPDVLGTMVNLGYLKMEEVPGIPVLPETPKNIVYAPLGDTPVDPDVVLFVAPAAKLMLLEEAAIRAGASSEAAHCSRGPPAWRFRRPWRMAW